MWGFVRFGVAVVRIQSCCVCENDLTNKFSVQQRLLLQVEHRGLRYIGGSLCCVEQDRKSPNSVEDSILVLAEAASCGVCFSSCMVSFAGM